jgi:hypothetical protein
MLRRTILILASFLFHGLSTIDCGLCDTIYTKDNKEIKGIILEDYKDRVLMSTVDGERTLMKGDIKELYFDTEEQNLIKLAEQARDRADYIKSFVYYDKAFRVNPNSKAAKDGIVFLQGYLFKKDMAKKEEDVNRRNEFEQKGAGPATIKTEEERFKGAIAKLKNTTGITLKTGGGTTQIESVSQPSQAYEAGVRSGDTLIAVWGRLVGYLSLQEVIETMLEKTSLETKFTVERSVNIGPGDAGVTFSMQFDGLTVSDVGIGSPAEKAGLKNNDIVTAIDGRSTRYMPLKKSLELIKASARRPVRLTFRREVVMWGKGE